MPARLGGMCMGRSIELKKKSRDTFLGTGESQTLARHQIEKRRGAAKLHHHRSERRAGKRIAPTAQNIGRIMNLRQKQLNRIETEFEKTRRCKIAMLVGRKIGPHPQNRLSPGHAIGKRC